MLRRTLLIALVLCAFEPLPIRSQSTPIEEADLLAALLKWQPGNVVADVGAGDGGLTLPASRFVGAAGKVYSTELDAKKLTHLEELAAKESNITALAAGVSDTNLPQQCCDSIFMRLVYHHLTKPAEIDASLFRALKPGGLLGVIDEDPGPGTSIPEGVPRNRIGHGVPQKVLIDELTAAGFQVVTSREQWPGRDPAHLMYAVIFRKPGA